jgi:carboxypeptidase T
VPSDSRLWIVAEAGDASARSAIADAGIAIEEVAGGKVGGIATAKAAGRLRARGVPFTASPLLQRFRPEDFPTADSAFHNYDRMESELKSLAASGAGLASVFSIGQSLLGKDLWALRLNTTASGQDPSPKPGIVFLGTHHAREHLSTEVPLLLAKYLIQNRAKPEVAKLLETRDIYIIPMVNPDGVEWDVRDGKYHMQRKNLRDNGDGTVGVDLNRNYGYHWGEGGASADPDDETYRGPSAFSEPETQAVKAFVEARKDTLKVLLTYHSFSELILYPWGHSNSAIPDPKALSAYQAMAAKMAQMTGYTPEQSSQLYIASGDTTDWAWGEHKIFSFTFELTPKSMWGGGFYPGAGAIASTFASNLRPALYLIGLADDPARAAADDAPL